MPTFKLFMIINVGDPLAIKKVQRKKFRVCKEELIYVLARTKELLRGEVTWNNERFDQRFGGME